ncbi:hypothetical protein K3495_g4341 [Podosphaera aphanis]|nr:hypothetical protein K3495_g4341 [Podosphaera aphanis]
MDINFGNDESGNFADGYPKLLSDDCVSYTVFLINPMVRIEAELVTRLKAVLHESIKMTEKLLENYIWQFEGFKLDLANKNGRICLYGTSHFGDSIEDEWLIVYILRELSRKFIDLWIQVVDTSGEFLLIEAANCLPRWLNPEIADNRVWINNNKLFLIPLIADSFKSTKTPTIPISRSLKQDEALRIIDSNPRVLIHSPLIEEEAFYRLRKYPDQVSAYMHHSLVLIPRKLAYILHKIPTSISLAIEAFYLRDPIALKPLQIQPSQLSFPPEDFVKVSTRFTKLLFAKLKSQQFQPPDSWKDVMANPEQQEMENYKQLKLGMKLTLGFEMLVKDLQFADNPLVRELKLLIEGISKNNRFLLPSDLEISQWKDVSKFDDESWLNIDIQDFERELDGSFTSSSKNSKKNSKQEQPPMFDNAKTQGDLRKIVERFEAFMNDEKAGPDGAELDDMDFDDDDEEDEDSSDECSDGEDKDVSFDEHQFERMLKEMMGMPPHDYKPNDSNSSLKESQSVDTSYQDDSNEALDIKMVMQKIGAELNEAGALKLDPLPTASTRSGITSESHALNEENCNDYISDEEVNIDYNLAKNLLESFKSQSGLAGPAGNLLGLMGLQLPRDEDET